MTVSLRKKILLVNVVLIVLLVALNALYSRVGTTYLKQSFRRNFETINYQLVQSLGSYIDSFEKISLMIMQSDRYQRIIQRDYGALENPQYQILLDQRWMKDELLSFYHLYGDIISSINIYNHNSGLIVVKGRNVELNPDYTPYHEQWFQEIILAQGRAVVTDQHIEHQASPEEISVVSLGRSVRNLRGEDLSVIIMNISPRNIAHLIPEKALLPGSFLALVDGNNVPLYQNTPGAAGTPAHRDDRDAARDGGTVVLQQELPNTSWRVVHGIPEATLYHPINRVSRYTLAIVGLVALVTIVLSVETSSSFTRPLEELNRAMHRIREGDLSTKVRVRSRDEIGYLSETFNSMVTQVNALMEQAICIEREKNLAELKFLQNQMSPHFTYNTLDSIRRLAEFQGATSVAQAIDDFVEILQVVTKPGSGLRPLREEAEFLKSYLSLLSLRYMNSFDYTIELDPDVANLIVPTLLLQPFVENAVFHGFQGDDRDFLLNVSFQRRGDMIHMMVQDNGIGFGDDTTAPATSAGPSAETTRVGIPNVRDRLQLFYADTAKVDISTGSSGTTVVVTVPDTISAEEYYARTV
jgi:two-component system, sensor histidine kinase YesM